MNDIDIFLSDLHLSADPDFMHTDEPLLCTFLDWCGVHNKRVLGGGDICEALYPGSIVDVGKMPSVQLMRKLHEKGLFRAIHGNHDEPRLLGKDWEQRFPFYAGNAYQTADIWVEHGNRIDFWCKNGPWDNIAGWFWWLWVKITRKPKKHEQLSKIVGDISKRGKFNQKMFALAVNEQRLVLCGHTHSPIIMGSAHHTRSRYANGGTWMHRADGDVLVIESEAERRVRLTTAKELAERQT